MLDAAAGLFAAHGYEATRMEQIAAVAEVAPATVYNYFDTKPNLLLALALRHVRSALPARRAFLLNPPEDPCCGINGFERLLAEQATRHLPRECWRVILAAPLTEPGGHAHRTAGRLQSLIRWQYLRLLRHYQRAGRLLPWIDVAALAEVILAVTSAGFARFVANEDVTLASVLHTSEAHLALILTGLLPGPSPHKETGA